MSSHSSSTVSPDSPVLPQTIAHVGAAVDAGPAGQDAAVLGQVIARAAGADLVLLSVEPDLLLIPGFDPHAARRQTEELLKRTRSSLAPSARIVIHRDVSIARGIRWVVNRDHRDVLAVGSSHRAPDGEVSISGCARQLLDQVGCALAIAPLGLSERPDYKLERIAVGYDGGPEAKAALAVAITLARGAESKLLVQSLVDDRVPALGWPQMWLGPLRQAWDEMIDEEVRGQRAAIERALEPAEIEAEVQVTLGCPGSSLRERSAEVDLLVIGSRRWGPMARLLLGGTGEALVHGAKCPLLVVPRPPRPPRP